MGLTRRIKVDNTTIEYTPDQGLRVKDLGITTAKIADQAVDAFKIARPAIIPDHLFTRSVMRKHLGIQVPNYALMNMRSTRQLGLWLNVRYGLTGGAASTWPADTHIRMWPFIPLNTIQVTNLRINITTAAGAGNELRLNFYDGNSESYMTSPDDPFYYWPRVKLLANDWIIDPTTTGIKSITLATPLTLDRGKMYWFAMQNNNVGTTPTVSIVTTGHQYVIGVDPANATSDKIALLLGNVSYGPLPNDISPYYASLGTSGFHAPSLQILFNYVSS